MTINIKIHVMAAAILLYALFIGSRLLFLQINYGSYFHIKSQKNFLRLQPVQPARGNILDRNGILLATNEPVYAVYWQGSGNYRLSEDQLTILRQLGSMVNTMPPLDSLLDRITRAERLHHKILLAHPLSYQALCSIVEHFYQDQNIVIETNLQRHYPYKTFASHIIGYLGDAQLQPSGKMGLEKLCEDHLRGTQGTLLNAINSFGKKIDQTPLEHPLMGDTIHTTLDINIQTIGESVFPLHYTGALVVMDPADGSLLAMISRPTFDPELFLRPIPAVTWQELQTNHTFLNRVFAGYPPGSIFKLVTTSAALEHNIINETDSWYCKGYTLFGNRKYFCARKRGHGKLSLKQAVAQSCNTLFFEISKQIDIDLLAEYAHKFGLGEKTGIIFSEALGLVPTHAWKKVVKGEPWWRGETLSAGIGQSYLLTSPIQIARMVASIFTGYLVRPRILADEVINTKPLEIKQSTREFLKRSMKSVIRRGTGKRIHAIKDLEIYAKTSTAQITSLEKSQNNNQYLEHGWFVAHFNYKNTRPLVLVVLVERAGTSQVPTSIAKDFLTTYKKMIDRQESAINS